MDLYKQLGGLLAVALSLLAPPAWGAEPQGAPRHLVFVSDPQYPWTDLIDDGLPDPDENARAKRQIERQYSDIANFRARQGGALSVPVMINGDITAFGHSAERSYMKSVFESKLEGVYDYGLGNHDYANNVDDCFLNNCAIGSVIDLKERYWGNVATFDLAARASGLRTIYYGSLAYSKSFGDVHMIQLNNEPTYAVSFSGGNPFGGSIFEITSALDWLEQDLRKARAQGRIIIVNMHKAYDWQGGAEQIARFQQLIERYRVTAVFGGHDHWGVGSYFDWNSREYFGDVPVFLSGSASQQSYLIASFSEDRQQLSISVVRDSDWSQRTEVKVIPALK
ncbi:Calcineurin-like phosphoesterase [Pseudomonas sp. ok272]|uniref:metallophosphoesterase family protein n=1 Tax=unclassified Pseudomonas TaxID=196821 RepID=UPI0008BA611F|nr:MULTISPECIES: metallophosphoesterase [unclassified Pseudomonas]SEM98900.1 Calcineurin-like phosphoesterase [Pseudomonas sp. ok272]SFM90376.1 Calcineurin-like phosphoesterase [Pseudomonas sp. ok602]